MRRSMKPSPPPIYARWQRGPSPRPDYFPMAVWLQNPANAAKYKAAGEKQPPVVIYGGVAGTGF